MSIYAWVAIIVFVVVVIALLGAMAGDDDE